ncbi:caspase domain-containing protein [Amycolatopsis sp. lyj-23]|uniref:caspase family protein n=1 Tax=Amycolatopsis sp. lyj-23 TaxID=2789283 RepID=UPI003977E563
MRLADPAGSKAILIGAAQYDDPALDDIAQARANVDDLAAVLADPELGGFLPGNVRTMVNPRHKDDAGLEIARWCRTATDTLIVYYAGHGLVDINSELLLATSDTIEAEKEFHSLRVETLRRAVNKSDARIKIVILDCCYSGRAFGKAMANEASGVLDQIETSGTCGLASAPRHLASLFVEGERHTVFSGELIRVLREGLPDEGALLSLSAVYRELRSRMRKREHPEPKITHSDSVSDFALVRNRAYRPAPAAPARAVAPPPPRPAAPPVQRPSPLHTIAEADALVSGFPRGGTTNTQLASAAMHPTWPVLARLRFVSELAVAGETFFAEQALQGFGVPDTARAVSAVKRLCKDLAKGRMWEKNDEWDVGELVPDGAEVTDVDARQLWGIAMAMLLAAAELPEPVRIQAIRELADLGHRDEAEWIAQGMLRDQHAVPALVADVMVFLSQAADGTPGRTGATPPAPGRSRPAEPPT